MRRAPGDCDAWRRVGDFFHQDIDVIYEDPEQLLSAFRGSLGDDRDEVVRLLEKSLATMTHSELNGLWNRSRSDLTITKGLRPFLEQCLDALR